MSYDALVLDHDGVLVDVFLPDRRWPLFHENVTECLLARGIEPPDAAFLKRLNGPCTHDQVWDLSSSLGLDPETLWRCRENAIEATLRAGILNGEKQLFDDVEAVLEIDRPRGIVSNNQRRIVEFALAEYDLAEYFDTIYAREPNLDSLTDKKPSPVGLHQTIGTLNATQPLFVGDSNSDVLAANRAGVDVAYIHREHNAAWELEATPTYELTSLDELRSLLAGDGV